MCDLLWQWCGCSVSWVMSPRGQGFYGSKEQLYPTPCGLVEPPGTYEAKPSAMCVKFSSPSNGENTLPSNFRVDMLSHRKETEEMLLCTSGYQSPQVLLSNPISISLRKNKVHALMFPLCQRKKYKSINYFTVSKGGGERRELSCS